jgi:hypothetical protein
MIPTINSIHNLTRQSHPLNPQEISQYYDFKINQTKYHRLTNSGAKLTVNLINLIQSIPSNQFALIKPIIRTNNNANLLKDPTLILLPEGFVISLHTPIDFVYDYLFDLSENAVDTLFEYKDLSVRNTVDLYSPTQYFSLVP